MKNLIIKNSGINKKGVFANKNFKKGEVVIKWKLQKIISEKNVKNLSANEQNHTSPSENGKYLIMGIPERFVNHSCNPNTYHKEKKDIAIRNIKKGEEITSDYSVNGINNWKIKCLCKSKNCRKIVYGDFFKLPKKIQKQKRKYLEKWFKEKFNIK